APTIGDQLLRRWWIRARCGSRWGFSVRRSNSRKSAAAEHHHHRNRTSRIGRRDQRHLNLDADRRKRSIVDMADELSPDHWTRANQGANCVRDRPGHFRYVSRNAAEYLTVEVLDDLRTPLIPPHRRGGDFLSVLQRQN